MISSNRPGRNGGSAALEEEKRKWFEIAVTLPDSPNGTSGSYWHESSPFGQESKASIGTIPQFPDGSAGFGPARWSQEIK